METVTILIFVLICLYVYLTPARIASQRNGRFSPLFYLANIFLGTTGIGWIVCFFIAVNMKCEKLYEFKKSDIIKEINNIKAGGNTIDKCIILFERFNVKVNNLKTKLTKISTSKKWTTHIDGALCGIPLVVCAIIADEEFSKPLVGFIVGILPAVIIYNYIKYVNLPERKNKINQEIEFYNTQISECADIYSSEMMKSSYTDKLHKLYMFTVAELLNKKIIPGTEQLISHLLNKLVKSGDFEEIPIKDKDENAGLLYKSRTASITESTNYERIELVMD